MERCLLRIQLDTDSGRSKFGIRGTEFATEAPLCIDNSQVGISVWMRARSKGRRFRYDPHGIFVVQFSGVMFEATEVLVYMVAGKVSESTSMVFQKGVN